jgi:hypothetical protein
VDHRRQRQEDVVDPVVVANQRAHRQHRALVAHDRLDDAQQSGGDGVVRGALALDDLVGGVADGDEDRFHRIAVEADPVRRAELGQAHPGDVRRAPDGTSLSPCSPTMNAWTERGSTP